MPKDDELDVQIAAETLSNLWKSGPNARTRAVAATATQVARSSSQLFNRVSKHPLVSIPVKMYRNSKSYSTRSAIKLRRMIARRRLKNTSTSTPGNVQKRWKQLMMSAGLASLSRESRQRMRYCLHMLRLATESLSVKVAQLHDIIEEEKINLKTKSRNKSKKSIRGAILALRRDIVVIIYKSIAVVSNVAGSALPEPARKHVRNYLMKIPSRWAAGVLERMEEESLDNKTSAPYELKEKTKKTELSKTNQNLKDEEISMSSVSKPAETFENSPTSINQSFIDEELNKRRVEVETGSRVLTLAQESLEAFDHIISIIGEILERAEVWVSREKNEKKVEKELELSDNESEYNTADEYESEKRQVSGLEDEEMTETKEQKS